MAGVSSRAEEKTTIEGGPNWEYTKRGRWRGQHGQCPPVVERQRERKRKRISKKEDRDEHTDIRPNALLDY
jgi:hypothetical protein